MKTYLRLPLIWLCLLSIAGSALAQPAWRDLPPEERRQLRQQMREHWVKEKERERGLDSQGSATLQELSPEENRRRWHDIPPEERHRLREELREQRQREQRQQESLGERPRERAAHPPPPR